MGQQRLVKDASADLLQKQVKEITTSGKRRSVELLKMFVKDLHAVTFGQKKPPAKK